MADTTTPSRRDFLMKAVAAAMAAPLGSQTPNTCVAQCVAPPGTGTNCGLGLVPVGEIRSKNGVLRAVLGLKAERRSVPYWNAGADSFDCRVLRLRAYEAWEGFSLDPNNLKTKAGVAWPGPTFRAEVGDLVQILFLNRIDERELPKTETRNNCDITKNTSGAQIYPKEVQTSGTPPIVQKTDAYPNCFHGSNTTNMHFHGFHVTPDGFGDNVLVQVVPRPRAIVERNAVAMFETLAQHPDWGHYKQNPALGKTFKSFRKRATTKNLAKDLVDHNSRMEGEGRFPQFWDGYFPYNFRIPKADDPGIVMGQAPGTHWYHAHKHGSTALHLLNGLAGVFVITGAYDREIQTALPNIQEQVLLLQQFAESPNLLMGSGGPPTLQVNGQLQPVINMQPGEIQLWRIVHGTVQANAIQNFVFSGPAGTPKFRQIAQDGVQFAFENYQANQNNSSFTLAPGNRVDLLVQAPQLLPGQSSSDSVLIFGPAGSKPPTPSGSNTLLRIHVASASPPRPVPTQFPANWNTKAGYIQLPKFLDDLPGPPPIRRNVFFQMAGGPGGPPTFYIDNKQFSETDVDKTMMLGTVEEWTVWNMTPIVHPFHIHVNPFQVTAIQAPASGNFSPKALPAPWVWWDTFALPPGANDASGKFVPGSITFRTRFSDFAGMFVLHCHILAHEDRGMMQLLQVVSNKTNVRHH
ncbi:MAG: hypothetical protein FJW39_20110 [Acidobacteria bacterium]|nr:hypothetical protein [Acidobacteriota bacterium]